MDMSGLGAGLAAFAFWGFIAVVVAMSIWEDIRKRDAQHETLRRVIESGQPIDEAVIEKIMDTNKDTARDFDITAAIILAIAPGLAVLGFALSFMEEDALLPLLGVAGLLLCIGAGMYGAARIAERANRTDRGPVGR